MCHIPCIQPSVKINWDSAHEGAWYNEDNLDIDYITAILESFSTPEKDIIQPFSYEVRPKQCSHKPGSDARNRPCSKDKTEQLSFNYGEHEFLIKTLWQDSVSEETSIRQATQDSETGIIQMQNKICVVSSTLEDT
jgi:hypothetical protein